MSEIIFNRSITVNGVPTNADTTPTIKIVRTDNAQTIVNTTSTGITNPSDGSYSYTLSDVVDGITYRATWTYIISGQTIVASSDAASSEFPILWTDIKYWLRLDGTSEQSQLLSLAADALAYAENYCEATLANRSLVTKHYKSQSQSKYFLPRGPVTAIASIVDADDRNITDFEYTADALADYVRIDDPYKLPITITYASGYSTLPNQLKRGILCHIELLYRERSGGGDMSGIHRCYDPYKRSQWVG